jgi:hypothetical protein
LPDAKWRLLSKKPAHSIGFQFHIFYQFSLFKPGWRIQQLSCGVIYSVSANVHPVNRQPERQRSFRPKGSKRNVLSGSASAKRRQRADSMAERPKFHFPTSCNSAARLKEEYKMSEAKKQPIMRVDFYPVYAAIWRNKSAEGGTFYSITFERKYKDKEGNYRNSRNFSASDLLLLTKAAIFAHTQICEFQAQDRAVTDTAALTAIDEE